MYTFCKIKIHLSKNDQRMMYVFIHLFIYYISVEILKCISYNIVDVTFNHYERICNDIFFIYFVQSTRV